MLQRRTKDVACAQNKQNYHFHPLISNQLLNFPKTDEFRAKILNFSKINPPVYQRIDGLTK